ncbi:winged helix DNA-binding domain-containing protein [Nocardia stercoris]|uniref:Winged helix DNA-binding domain-containing protein n=1 Tax=Nocardia stercoris TaxID=2483361 RepID=A0A3M2L4Y8_9NOCA|nr:winged helix DNA-binding domain-containing protein [Nocardia stercoris]RMI30945.1 winged helix DNA-binding domain-containing protein [Nocardia stercoris]
MELSDRILNRTLLDRHHLLERMRFDAARICDELVGLQAQDTMPPFVGLWSRTVDFDPTQLDRALHERSLVRITVMRGTIHLVTPADAVRIVPHIQPELEKAPFRKGFNYGAMVGLDPEEVRARGQKALGDEPMPAAALREIAAREYPDRDAGAVLQTWLYQLPVLQTPPRGLWKNNSRPVWSRIEPWLGIPLDHTYPAAELVLRYLRAYGPASSMDVQAWSRLTGIKKALDTLGDRVRTYTDARGRTLYDAADAVLADPDRPAPARFLGWYDNVYLSHADRSRIIPGGRPLVLRHMASQVSPLLVDGFVAGRYKVFTDKTAARLRVLPDRLYTSAETAEVEAEGAALLRFLEPDLRHAVEILAPGATLQP